MPASMARFSKGHRHQRHGSARAGLAEQPEGTKSDRVRGSIAHVQDPPWRPPYTKRLGENIDPDPDPQFPGTWSAAAHPRIRV